MPATPDYLFQMSNNGFRKNMKTVLSETLNITISNLVLRDPNPVPETNLELSSAKLRKLKIKSHSHVT